MPQHSRRVLPAAALTFLLVLMEALMVFSVHGESQTSDEAYSLFAGYMHLTQGNFFICPAYPPLIKEVAALPLLTIHPAVPAMTPEEMTDFRSGRIFLFANHADSMLFAARVAMTIFPLLLAGLVFLAALEMFGYGPAWIALILTVFEPNLLAHGPLVTNDVALACFLFATVYAFWRYLEKPSIPRLLLCGLAAGLTLASKHSGLIVFGILPLLVPLAWLGDNESSSDSSPQTASHRDTFARVGQLLLSLVAIAAIAFASLWGFYGFRYAPIAGQPAPSLDSVLQAVPSRSAATAMNLAAKTHLLPEAYLDGLAFFFNSSSRPTYLLGRLYPHGVWYYFPIAFLIKSTLGFLLVLGLAVFAPGLRRSRVRRKVLCMAIPAAVYLAVSMTSQLNIGIRHLLPIFPFLIVLASAGAWDLAGKGRWWKYAVFSLLGIHALSSLRAYPDYLPYSNELWGGPTKTYRVLTDSNVDWGQGLPALKTYLAKHASEPCWLAYFGSVDPAEAGIPCKFLPVHTSVVWERTIAEIPPVVSGTVLVSATEMSGQAWGPGELNPYDQFRSLPPADSIGGSILVYRGTFQLPLASALSMLGKVVELANHGDFQGALAHADAAATLAPRSVDVQFVRGRLLHVMGRNTESQRAFANALQLAMTIHPEAQSYWIPIIEQEMRTAEAR